MPNHNFIAEPGQYPSHIKILGYSDKKAFNDRYKKTAVERAEIFAAKITYEMDMKKQYGPNWKQKLNNTSREFNKSIVSNTKVLYAWN